MSDSPTPGPDPTAGERDEMLAEIFAQMVMQQANLAMMLLGKVPHPQTGQTVRDLDGAQMFIDQLEMLQAKTKGNLSRQEEQLLKQSLMSLQMAFVQAVESPAAAPASTAPADPAPAPAEPSAPAEPESQPAPPTQDDAGRKKFSRKY